MSLKSPFEISPLHEAVAMKELDAVRRLLDEGADVNALDCIGCAPLTVACTTGAEDILGLRKAMKDLMSGITGEGRPATRLDSPPDFTSALDRISNLDVTKLAESALGLRKSAPRAQPDETESLPLLALLLDRGADPNGVAGEEQTPLGAAAGSGRVESIRLLLDRGAKIDALDGSGKTALMHAAEEGWPAVVALLVDRGADARKTTDGRTPPSPDDSEPRARAHRRIATPAGVTALHGAAKSGRVEIARWLIEVGADVNAASARGGTPLLSAIMAGHAEMAEYLSAQGARTGFLEALALGDHEAARRLPTPDPAERPPAWGYGALTWAVRAKNREAIALLVERGVVPDPRLPDGQQIIRMATLRGGAEILAQLTPRCVSLSSLGDDGMSPLGTAVFRNDIDSVRHLIARGADVNQAGDGASALTKAVMRGHAAMVRLLLEAGADPNGSGDIIGPLGTAAQANQIEIVRMLLDAGADPDIKHDGTSMASVFARNKPEIQALLKEYADRRRASQPPPEISAEARLLEAAKAGDLEAMHGLLDAGCPVDPRDRLEMTPLLWAINKGHAGVARLLLERGADVHAVNSVGGAAIRIAARRRSADLIALLKEHGARIGLPEAATMGDLATLRSMLGAGVEADACGPDGDTALMIAAAVGSLEMVTLLLDRGADPERCDYNLGSTALSFAASGNRLPVMELLLARGADPNGAGPARREQAILDRLRAKLSSRDLPLSGFAREQEPVWGRTPMHAVALRDSYAAAFLLLDRGADMERKAGMHRATPLIVAAQHGSLQVARLLLERGADIHAMNTDGETALYYSRALGKNAEVTALLAEASDAKDRSVGGAAQEPA
ncbi:MAG TPA: ankyrin repeat domain-containing protein [Chthonomonadaceae bacterium]|nr:ankyrin repeat domain-containing protein [Chthonomonadaceae bacterium]